MSYFVKVINNKSKNPYIVINVFLGFGADTRSEPGCAIEQDYCFDSDDVIDYMLENELVTEKELESIRTPGKFSYDYNIKSLTTLLQERLDPAIEDDEYFDRLAQYELQSFYDGE